MIVQKDSNYYSALPLKRFAVILAIFGAFSISGFVIAITSMAMPRTVTLSLASVSELKSGNVEAGKHKVHIDLESTGVRVSHGIYDLGHKYMPVTMKKVRGFVFVHHTDDYPGHLSVMNSSSAADALCYAFLSDGTIWKTINNWYLNPINTQNLNQDYLLNAFTAASAEWGSRVTTIDLAGTGALNTHVSPSLNSPDGLNVVAFGSIAQASVLAVTYTWGIYDGPIADRQIIEWDMVQFNDSIVCEELTGIRRGGLFLGRRNNTLECVRFSERSNT